MIIVIVVIFKIKGRKKKRHSLLYVFYLTFLRWTMEEQFFRLSTVQAVSAGSQPGILQPGWRDIRHSHLILELQLRE